MWVVLTQILKGNNIARFINIVRLIGYPDFNFIDGYGRKGNSGVSQPCVVIVSEILRKEKVAVCIVIGSRNFIIGDLCTPFCFNRFAFAFML